MTTIRTRPRGGSDYHSPMVTLRNDRGNAVGRRCLHCGTLWTMAGNPSEPFKVRGRGGHRPNKAHAARVAGTPVIGEKMARKIMKAYRKAEKAQKKGDHS